MERNEISFKLFQKSSNDRRLPDPNGPLSKTISPSTIAAMNTQVGYIVEKHDTTSANKESERGPYLHLTAAQKYQEQLKLAVTGVTNTLPYYAKNFPMLSLKETTIQRLKNSY